MFAADQKVPKNWFYHYFYVTNGFDVDSGTLHFYFHSFLLNFNWILSSIQEHHQRL